MGRSQQSFAKKEREKKKAKKKKEKLARREERKENNMKGEGLDNMISYVDEYGNVTDTPPDPSKKEEIAAEDIVVGVPKKGEYEEDPIKKGKVDFYNDEKGYGFIKENETNDSYFVHINSVSSGELSEGDKVTFELEKGPKGLNAVNVKHV